MLLCVWQPLDRKKLAAMLGVVDVNDASLMMIAAFAVKNVVNGNRARQEWLLDWDDVKEHLHNGITLGVTTAVGLTKTDRLQRGETKPLQCVTGCTGKLECTAKGTIDAERVCPAHLLLYAKELWAQILNVAVENVKGGNR